MIFCTNCGKQLKDGARFCTACGKALKQKTASIPVQVPPAAAIPVKKAPAVPDVPVSPVVAVNAPAPVKVQIVPEDDGGLKCKKCGSSNVSIQIMQRGETTKRKGVGLGGNVNNLARGITAIGTLGLSNLVWKKSEGVNKTQIKNVRMAICQNCGRSWSISILDNIFGM